MWLLFSLNVSHLSLQCPSFGFLFAHLKKKNLYQIWLVILDWDVVVIQS